MERVYTEREMKTTEKTYAWHKSRLGSTHKRETNKNKQIGQHQTKLFLNSKRNHQQNEKNKPQNRRTYSSIIHLIRG